NINMNVTRIPANFSCSNPLVTQLEADEAIKHDFRIVSIVPVQDLGITLSAQNASVDTGRSIQLGLSVRNNGTATRTATVKMFVPNAYSTIRLGNGNIVNDTLVWTFTIKPFQTVSNWLEYNNTY